jgi:hypothetical protein
MDTSINKRQGRTVKLHPSTVDRINRLKHRGQSYDGVISELLDFHDSYVDANHNHHTLAKIETRSKARAGTGSDLVEEKADA